MHDSAPALDVLAIGRVVVDLYPESDGPLTEARLFRSAIGGSPANVAVAAARLGLRVGLVSRVGDDPLGRFVLAELDRHGIDTRQTRALPGVLTPLAVCEIDPPDRFPLTFYRPEPPADLQVRADSLDRERIESARILWTSLSGLSGEPARSAVLTALSWRESLPGAQPRHSVLDLDYRASFWATPEAAGEAARAALPGATIVIGNLEECRIALGLGAEATPDDAADALLDSGAGFALVKLGGEGVLGATATERRRVAPITVEVVNGLGAGDAFGGAVCAALLDGLPLEQLLMIGNAAGALVASRRGASSAMPSRAEVDALLVTSSG